MNDTRGLTRLAHLRYSLPRDHALGDGCCVKLSSERSMQLRGPSTCMTRRWALRLDGGA
jgi:hypothetical protein